MGFESKHPTDLAREYAIKAEENLAYASYDYTSATMTQYARDFLMQAFMAGYAACDKAEQEAWNQLKRALITYKSKSELRKP